jgi:D-alanyl-D-alanine carboxypeptidase
MKLLYLCLFSFIFIGFFTLVISPFNANPIKQVPDKIVEVKAYSNLPPIPQMTGQDSEPNFTSLAVIATDLDSGAVIYQKNADSKLLPASTTKIVTALVAMDYYPLDEILTVSDFSVEGQKMRLIPGEEITVKNLIYGLLVYSANDAAEVLARNYPGGKESFVTAMNLKVQEIGLENTFFENPTGLDGYSQFTTARDLAGIANVAIQNSFFKEVVATKEITVGSSDGKYIHKMTNINKLLGEIDGVMGIKTGWTENARENLVTYIKRDDRHIVTVVLGSQDRFGETKSLIDWLFANYSWKKF